MPRDIIPDISIDSPTTSLLRLGYARIQHGWLQRHAIRQLGGNYAFCASAALVFDGDGQLNRDIERPVRQAENALQLAISKLMRVTHNRISVVQFNDSWDRTKADVELAYEVAIELQIRSERGLPI
jgi:hypothetical protein